MKQTFEIPKGCSKVTIEQVGNTIVTSFEEEFKEGDVCYSDTMIWIEKTDGTHYALLGSDGNLWKEDDLYFAANKRHAAESEAQQLFDALAKNSKQWNAEKLCIEDLKVEPKVGDLVKITSGRFIAYFQCNKDGEFIFKNEFLNNVDGTFKIAGSNNSFENKLIYGNNENFEILTPDQFQSEVNALGFQYDFENDNYSVLKWKPKDGEICFSTDYSKADGFKCTKQCYDVNSYWMSAWYNHGRLHQTESECLAKIEQIKAILK